MEYEFVIRMRMVRYAIPHTLTLIFTINQYGVVAITRHKLHIPDRFPRDVAHPGWHRSARFIWRVIARLRKAGYTII